MLLRTTLATLVVVGVLGRPQDEPIQSTEKQCEPTEKICMTKECIETSNRLFQNMDKTADPCEDFNQFACGNFIANNVIPEDKGRISAFTPLSEVVYVRGKNLLESNQSKEDFDSYNHAKNLYKSCMAQDEIEEAGLKPMENLLQELGGWPVLEGDKWDGEQFQWYDFILKSNELGTGINYIMKHSISQDTKNISWRVIELDQPSLGMSREYLIKGFDDKDVQHYYTYMVDAAKLFGADDATAKKEMKDALLFEIAIAEASTARELRRDPNSKYNPTTVKDFPELPGYPPSLKEYLNGLVQGGGADKVKIGNDEKIILKDPKYFQKSSKILVNTEKRAMSNYLGWRIVKSMITKLNKAAQILKENYNRSLKGIAKAQADWKRCVKAVGFNSYQSYALSGLSSSMYVRKHFRPEQKKAVEEMITYIRAAFEGILKDLDWMDDVTKEKAKKKMKEMDQFIAYPDELLDAKELDGLHEGLDLTEDYFQNYLNLNKFWRKRTYNQLREKFDPKHWTEHQYVALVNAFYNPDINSMEFPAGILQGAFFNSKAPMYVNFGGIGAVIGHEITHGFDDQGRTQDYEGIYKVVFHWSNIINIFSYSIGKLVDWWAPETAAKYKERAQCIIDQYGNYTAEQINLNLNGINTQGENIADNGGIKESYMGYSKF